MGIYGSLPKVDVNQFVFDKVYPNRVTMDAEAANDGVFPGRYVRIEYGEGATYSKNQKDDLDTYNKNNSNGGRDYDSTVWQKYIDTEGNHKYIMVAELQPTTYVIDWLNYDGEARENSTKDELYGEDTGGIYLVQKWLQDDTEAGGGTYLVNDWLQKDKNNGGTYLVKEWLKDSANNVTGTDGGTKLVQDFITIEQAEWNAWETQAKQDLTQAKTAAETATTNADAAAASATQKAADANTAAQTANAAAQTANAAAASATQKAADANTAAQTANTAAQAANEAVGRVDQALTAVNITFKTDSGSATSTSFTISNDNIIQVSAPESNKLSFAHADSGVTAETYGSTTQVPQITVDQYGHITGVTPQSISIPAATTVNGQSGAVTIEGKSGGPISVYPDQLVETKNIIEFTWPDNLILQCTL